MTHLERQAEFHRAFGHPVVDRPQLGAVAWHEPGDPDLAGLASRLRQAELVLRQAALNRRRLRVALLLEEVAEYLEAEAGHDLVAIADALGDIGVICDGTALEYGIPLDQVREEIHRANMSKLGADGSPVYREDGKIQKGADYTPPDIAGLLQEVA